MSQKLFEALGMKHEQDSSTSYLRELKIYRTGQGAGDFQVQGKCRYNDLEAKLIFLKVTI